ncbi:MAG: hypothetical protein J1E36_06075 [Eubacterium sp.]|nr:hypothetical protein [Eubacterium sp.]
MDRTKYDKNLQRSNILYWTVGSLLIITMLSVWLLSGLMAKYTVAGDATDSARVANGIQIELLEHEAVPINGIYYLKNEENAANPDLEEITEVKEKIKNDYDLVIPGVDIAKDPFVRLNGTSEVDYYLYIEITESKNFPETITYSVSDDWEPVKGKSGVYKYKSPIDSGTYDDTDIYILKNNELIVSQYYYQTEFSLSFKAWVKQVD